MNIKLHLCKSVNKSYGLLGGKMTVGFLFIMLTDFDDFVFFFWTECDDYGFEWNRKFIRIE